MMDKERWLPPIRCMHEWPLVIFTALVVPAAGLYASTLVADLAGVPFGVPAYLRGISAALLTGGLVFSFLHLGRPRRAPLALWRVGRNWLSTEVALATALTAIALALLLPSPWQGSGVALQRLAGALAAGLLVTFGLVYFLRAHWPWRTALVAGPLLTGLTAGIVLLAAVPDNGALLTMAIGAIVIDALFCLAAWREPRERRALPSHPAIHEYRRRLLALRLLFTNLLPMGLLLAGFRPSAAIAIGTGVLLDRFSFYGLAGVETTEACVADVEGLIAGRSGRTNPT